MTTAKKAAAKPARQAEVERDEPTVFEHKGITFTIPAPLDLPLELMECEDEYEAVKVIVGNEQWDSYMATKPTLRDFRDFAAKVNGATGEDEEGN